MRVVHLSKVTGIAGSEGHLLRLLPGLISHGCDAHLLMLEDPRQPVDHFCDQLAAHGVPVERLRIRSHLDPKLPGEITRRLEALKPDLAHTHLLHGDVYGLAAAKRAGVKYTLSSRHNDDKFRRQPLIRWLNLWAMRHADRVIAISHALARFVRDVEGIDQPKIVTVHYGLDAPPVDAGACRRARAELGYDDHQPVIGMFGRLIHQKGVDVLLDAWPAVLQAHPDARLLIVGAGPDRSALEAQATKLGIKQSARFTGWVEGAARLMPACDAITVPSRWEGFGLVTLEAMGCKLPVIASRTSALPEIVAHEETGLLVPPGEPAALADAINRLIGDSALAQRLGGAGYKRLVAEFSVDKMVCATLAVYENLLTSGAK